MCDREHLNELLSDMPCDNQDDPRLVAQNELFAEQAEIELTEMAANAKRRPS